MKISIGFSPCPNDTFMFAALVNGWIDTGGLDFDVHMLDVESLNKAADKATLDITKLSFHKGLYLEDRYTLLHAGAALGRGCGPLVISREPMRRDQLESARIVLPGEWTTAHLLFSHFHPEARQKSFHVFSEIEGLVLDGMADAGVIIHENRFTYAAKGLFKVEDLGDSWERQTGLPIPLGGIFGSKRLENGVLHEVDLLIRKSVIYAREHEHQVMPFVRDHAQEMEESVMRQHIDLYVNEFSLDLGPEGRLALAELKKNLT